MSHKLLGIATVLSILLVGLAATPAEAGHSDWYIGGGFRIGPIHFNLVLGHPGHRRHAGHYYYRTHDHLAYDGYRCNDRCFKERRYTYHDVYCPVVLRHYEVQRWNPYRTFERYAPRYGRYYGQGPYDEYRGRTPYRRHYYERRYHHRDRYEERHPRHPYRPPYRRH